MSKLLLKRFGASPFMPAPEAVRAGDYVFTSSIYPVDQAGHAVTVDAARGETGPSLVEAQTRDCLGKLAVVLKNAGSALDRVLKAEVHLVDAADFVDFKRVWREHFPVDPPARTTLEVGDTFPFPGVRLNIDVVALAGDSALKREVLHDPQGDDVLEAEWASHAVRAGNMVFCSAFPATDFKTGIAVGRRPGFPNYGSDAELQAAYVFERMNRMLAGAGTSLEQAVESQLYEPDLSTFHDVDGVWKRYMPSPPCRSSMGAAGLITPGACFVPNLTVLVPDAEHSKQESHEGLSWHPVEVRKVNFAPTIKAGQWRFFAGQIPSPDFLSWRHAPPGLPNHFSDIEVQTRFTLELLTKQLKANDTDWDHCHHVRLYLVEPKRDFRGFARVWREFFPDQDRAPALAYVPSSGIMFPGPLIEIDPTCIAK